MLAIEKGNKEAMSNLEDYYSEHMGEKSDEMKKYYMLAIEKGNKEAMFFMGDYYENIEQNYDEMKKHYILAIEKGHQEAMRNLKYYLKENISKLYKDFEDYYPILDKLDISEEHKYNIRNIMFMSNKLKVRDLQVPDCLKQQLLLY